MLLLWTSKWIPGAWISPTHLTQTDRLNCATTTKDLKKMVVTQPNWPTYLPTYEKVLEKKRKKKKKGNSLRVKNTRVKGFPFFLPNFPFSHLFYVFSDLKTLDFINNARAYIYGENVQRFFRFFPLRPKTTTTIIRSKNIKNIVNGNHPATAT